MVACSKPLVLPNILFKYSNLRVYFLKATRSQTLNSFLYAKGPPYITQASPIAFINASYPPTFILTAMADKLIPIEQSFILKERLEKAGVEYKIKKAKGAFHGFVDVPVKRWPPGVDWWEAVILPSLEWAKGKAEQ